jgi:hypothetical protein
MAYGLWPTGCFAIKTTVWQVFAPAKPAFPPSLAVTAASACDMHGRINAAGAWMRRSGRKLATQSAEQPVGPEGRALKRAVAALHFLPRATAITCEVRLAPVRFRSRRGHMPLFRGALVIFLSAKFSMSYLNIGNACHERPSQFLT